MTTRRLSLITSLILTAAMLYALPALWGARGAGGRAQERLLPPKARTLSVWLASDDVNDRRLINELCAEYEKRREGVRVFLRRVDAEELNASGDAPPDVALYTQGIMREPSTKLISLAPPEDMRESMICAGKSGGVCYALPLWYEASALSFPSEWSGAGATPAPRGGSLLGQKAPVPVTDAPPFANVSELPWRSLLAAGALERPLGVEWQQLLYCCPAPVRGELIAALKAGMAAGGSGGRSAGKQSAGKGGSSAPSARIAAYSRLRADASASLRLCALSPAVSHSARMASVMRDSDEAQAFLRFLLSNEAQEAALSKGLMPSMPPVEVADGELAALSTLYGGEVLLVNAYEHTREELLSLCEDAFFRLEEPALTLIKLR